MPYSKSWVRDLANTDSSREILSYEKHSNPTSVLRDESINALTEINKLFFEYANEFNRYLKSDSTPLKVLGITNNQSFMVFRNNYRLVTSIYEPGVLLFSFENFTGNLYSNIENFKDTLASEDVYNSGNILVGNLGPFNEVNWMFENQPIKLQNVVRHYFTEFVKASTSLMKNAPLGDIRPRKKGPDATV